MAEPELWTVDFPAPTVAGPRCRACEGAGVTGERYALRTGADRQLLADVFCPACDGCGSADPDHRACDPAAHASIEFDDVLDDDVDDEPVCPSCQGRTWIAVQGFDEAAQAGRSDGRVLYLRLPCGCTADRARRARPAGEAGGDG